MGTGTNQNRTESNRGLPVRTKIAKHLGRIHKPLGRIRNILDGSVTLRTDPQYLGWIRNTLDGSVTLRMDP